MKYFTLIEQLEQYWYQTEHANLTFRKLLDKLGSQLEFELHQIDDDTLIEILKVYNYEYAIKHDFVQVEIYRITAFLDYLRKWWEMCQPWTCIESYCNARSFSKSSGYGASDDNVIEWIKVKLRWKT